MNAWRIRFKASDAQPSALTFALRVQLAAINGQFDSARLNKQLEGGRLAMLDLPTARRLVLDCLREQLREEMAEAEACELLAAMPPQPEQRALLH